MFLISQKSPSSIIIIIMIMIIGIMLVIMILILVMVMIMIIMTMRQEAWAPQGWAPFTVNRKALFRKLVLEK